MWTRQSSMTPPTRAMRSAWRARDGADLNARDKYGWTPLGGVLGPCRRRKASLGAWSGYDRKDKDGKTTLDLARVRGHRGVLPSWRGGWGGEGSSRPGAALVRSASDAVCEACCEAWRIIDQVYDFMKEARAMTAKELEDLEDLFHRFKGHVEALERMTARPDAVKELMSFRDYVELLLPHLERGDLPGDAVAKITSMRDRFKRLREELGCRC